MKYLEIRDDLFKYDKEYYLVHCISRDFALGAGIAKEFDKRYSMREKLFLSYRYPKYQSCGNVILIDTVFNLVTKNKYWHKPTLESLTSTLYDMKKLCEKNGVSKLAMPKIGCGLDKLNWEDVKQQIMCCFQDTDIEILVCIKE